MNYLTVSQTSPNWKLAGLWEHVHCSYLDFEALIEYICVKHPILLPGYNITCISLLFSCFGTLTRVCRRKKLLQSRIVALGHPVSNFLSG